MASMRFVEGDARRACRDALNFYPDRALARLPVIVACRVEAYESMVASQPRAELLAVNLVVDPDRLLGAAQLAEDHALVVEGH